MISYTTSVSSFLQFAIKNIMQTIIIRELVDQYFLPNTDARCVWPFTTTCDLGDPERCKFKTR